MRFYAVEIDASRPDSAARTFTKGWSVKPWGPLSRRPYANAATDTLRASTAGYRTREADAGGLLRYPAHVDQAFSIDRLVNLNPAASGVAAGAGSVILANPGGVYDDIVGSMNADGRRVQVYHGAKAYDPTRGYFVDPARADLQSVFTGMALPWVSGDGRVTVPLRDPTWWLENPVQANTYSGAGGYNGHTGLTGTRMPKTRGGTLTDPVRNVTPVLIDPVNRVYQCSDAGGGIAQVYEAGNPVFVYESDTTNLFSGSTTAGKYRTDVSRVCFQLGSAPVGEITADVWGNFPTAGAISNAANVIKNLLLEDIGVPSGNVDAATFAAIAAAYAYPAGVYFHPSANETGVQAVDRLLTSLGARLIPLRAGTLALWLFDLASTQAPGWSFGRSNAMALRADPVDTPAWRIALQYKRNHTRQVSGVSAGATAAQRAYIAGPGEVAPWFDGAVATAYARPRDVLIQGGALLREADALAVAARLGAVFGTRRRAYWLEVPTEAGLPTDLGRTLRVTWPVDDLRSGQVAWITGDRIRSQDGTMLLRVLV